MSTTQNVNVNSAKTYVGKRSKKGELRDIYSPFFNLVDSNNALGDFTTEKLNFDMEHPVDITLQDSYDGSVNVIFNDDKNNPRLVNSRFSVLEGKTYLIPDHKGHKDTNLYNVDTFKIDTHLKKVTNKIPKLSFEGILDGGQMLCGQYTFYFKFADADDNETEVVAESGIVQCHIGAINDPGKIRMGMENEDSQKIVKFKLTNIDLGFDYVKVLYTRISSDSSLAITPTYHMIDYKYPILNGLCDIYIRGNETILGCEPGDILTDYADIDAVKTQEQDDNILFFGNIAKPEHDWEALGTFARQIHIECGREANIGSLNSNYKDIFSTDSDHAYGYYNMKNVYYRVGYWPEEYYRFGIVYQFDDDSLSPVFNILGGIVPEIDADITNDPYVNYASSSSINKVNYEPEDFFYDKTNFINCKGVVKLPKADILLKNNLGILTPTPLYLKFVLNSNSKLSVLTLKSEHKVKGFFFVRQKRIPNIVALGLIIGKTTREFGSIPVLKQNGSYRTRSFLQKDLVLSEGQDRDIEVPGNNAANNAMIVPDAILRDSDYNQLFVSNDWKLDPKKQYVFTYNGNNGILKYKTLRDTSESEVISKLTSVAENTKIITNGEVDDDGEIKDADFFSTMAGDAGEAYKTIDVKHIWSKTVPLTLTKSDYLVRGLFGDYVGLSYTDFPYGTLVNIKKNTSQNSTDYEIEFNEFQTRIFDSSSYYTISDREEISIESISNLKCYRGDCYISFFTHRIIRNFTDPDLPTNTKVVDPLTWAKNYAVRCTCDPNGKAYSNLKRDYTGWYIDDGTTDPDDFDFETDPTNVIEFAERSSSDLNPTEIVALGQDPSFKFNDGSEEATDDNGDATEAYYAKYVNEIALAFEIYVGTNRRRKNLIRIVNSKELEKDASSNPLKTLFRNSANWETRGLANLNRGDVNAIPVGQWITFPLCSNENICLRDVDFSDAEEEAKFSRKRSFYPLSPMDPFVKQRDSNVINAGCINSITTKPYVLIPDTPFFRQEYNNRVYYSNFDASNRIRNAFRVFNELSYLDYPKMYGSITRLIEHNKQLICVCEHGVLLLPVHERILSGAGVGGETYINLKNVLPESPVVVTDEFGSMWKNSIFSTKRAVYGVDTVAKKIWKYSENGFACISDMKVLKFLNDHIDLSEFTKQEYVGHVNVKTHYNDFKHDVIFTYYNDKKNLDSDGNWDGTWIAGESWSLCYNEDLEIFTTFYDWIPLESENVDNIWFSFDRDKVDSIYGTSIPQLTYNYINKASIDRAFTYNITYPTHCSSKLNKTLISVNKGFNAFTFYAKTNDSNGGSITVQYQNQASAYTNKFDTEGNWKFFIGLFNMDQDRLLNFNFLSSDMDISEFKVTLISEDDKEFRQLLDEISNPISFREIITIDPNADSRFISLRGDGRFMELWKHGQAGLYDNQGIVRPTNWYGKQHEFNFEFVVSENTQIQKIYNNLKIISNKIAPFKFEFEIDGDGYNWSEYKDIIEWINQNSSSVLDLDNLYQEVLTSTYGVLRNKYVDFPQLFGREDTYQILKLPYLHIKLADKKGTKDQSLYINQDPKFDSIKDNSSDTILVEDYPLSEKRVHVELLGNDIKHYGRLRGNMEYLEDVWDVEIRPLTFRYVYYNNGLQFTKLEETRLRDKYLKVKIRYTGEDLSVIQGVISMFDYSFA